MLEFGICGTCQRPLAIGYEERHAAACKGPAVMRLPDPEKLRVERLLEQVGCQRVPTDSVLYSAWRKPGGFSPDARWFVGANGEIRVGRIVSKSARCSEADLQGWIAAMRSGVVAG